MKVFSSYKLQAFPILKEYGNHITLILLLLFVALIRIRLLNIPLERDEGEYAYMGQLILQGIPPYEIAYNMKFPGTYFIYAFFMLIFGQTIEGIHLGLLIVNLTSIILIFFLAKKLMGNCAALSAASAFAILSISTEVLGFASHATHFLIPWAIAGTLILYNAITSEKRRFYFLSGLLLGFAPIMKQHGIFFCLFGFLFLVIYFYYKKYNFKNIFPRLLIFISGGIIPFAITIVYLILSGVFQKFWFWTIDYAQAYGSIVPLSESFNFFKYSFGTLFLRFYPILICMIFGFTVLFFHPGLKMEQRILIILFSVFSFLSTCPGFYFRPHYFVMFLPAVAILFGVFIDFMFTLSTYRTKPKIVKSLVYILLFLLIAYSITIQTDYFFRLSHDEISKKSYKNECFSESLKIASYVKANSCKNDKIAILGSEPQIFFYANRHSATGYIYVYSLMEKHKNCLKMQKEMIQEIQTVLPRYLIYFHVRSSWAMQTYSEKHIIDWAEVFLKENGYKVAGITDLQSSQTIYKWDKDVNNYKPLSHEYIVIYER